MKNATVLTIQGSSGTPDELTPFVETISAQRGRMAVLYVGGVPRMPSYATGASPFAIPVVPDTWITQRNDLVAKMTTTQDKTRNMLKKAGLTGEVAVVCMEPALLHEPVAKWSLFADLCVVQNSMRQEKWAFDNVMYGLLFEGAAPLLLNAAANANALTPDHVMIAWNSTQQAARAVRGALPLLKSAKEVTITCLDPVSTQWDDGESPGADLAAWLSHHGCRVTVHEYPTGGKSVADALLDRAQAQGADLLVMGAYGRNRLNQRFFGGTTLSMLEQTELPVLMAH